MPVSRGSWLLALTAGYVALACTAAASSAWGAPIALLVLAAEAGARRFAPQVRETLRAAGAEESVRCLFRGSLLVVIAVRAAHVPTPLLAGLVGSISLLVAEPIVGQLLGRRAELRIRDQVRWHGLEVAGRAAGPAGVPMPSVEGPACTEGVSSAVECALAAAVGCAVAGRVLTPGAAWGRFVLGTALVAAAACLLLLICRAVAFDRAARSAPDGAVLPSVVAALMKLAPTVVLYFSSPPSGSYALRVWLDTLRRLHERVVVVLREADHLDTLDLSDLPVVVLPTAQHVEAARVPSMRLVLYPTNVMKNNHMIRIPGLRHVFIGHGDSDKAGSASPVSRAYDEIWVAGEAGRDRYRAAAEGVRPDQVRVVGRPQLAGLGEPAPVREDGEPPTVLYAPTWEGFYQQSDYSSVAPLGLDAVRAMVSSGRVRVLFKPHPATGQRRPDAAAAVAEIERLVAASPHERLPDGPEALYEGMRRAHVLITDVSSVLSDWMACRRPYVVTNPQRLTHTELHERFPTARGGSVLDPGCDVMALLDEALTADRMATAREELATYVIGPPSQDPLQDFLDEVTAAVERTAAAPRELQPAR